MMFYYVKYNVSIKYWIIMYFVVFFVLFFESVLNWFFDRVDGIVVKFFFFIVCYVCVNYFK